MQAMSLIIKGLTPGLTEKGKIKCAGDENGPRASSVRAGTSTNRPRLAPGGIPGSTRNRGLRISTPNQEDA